MERDDVSSTRSVRATRTILDLAAVQHGVVSRKQLIAAGLHPRLIENRIVRNWLTPVFPGVYALDPGTVNRFGLWLGATMTSGSRIVLSHRSAAEAWRIGKRFPRIELLSPSMRKGKITDYLDRSLIVHQTRSLPQEDVAEILGIPVTSVSRTLIDFAAVSSKRELSSAFNEADRLGLLDVGDLSVLIERSRGRKGIAEVRTLVQVRDPGNRRTRSELESNFLSLCRANDIPLPEVNVKVLEFEVDCLWRNLNFIVELDGLAFHSHPTAVERDLHRVAKLQASGYLVLRLTYRDVIESPARTVAVLKRHMERATRQASQ
ncbi:MAG: type IV toxin-antitoxin system AbiEi family antitoxin domain-containing protein [Solirubrobacterales bacterium]